MMQRIVMGIYGLVPPFYTPRAVIWNIRTLGFVCWAQCLAQNAYYVVASAGRTRRPARVALKGFA